MSFGGKGFQINRPVLHKKIARPQSFDDCVGVRLFIVKGNHQIVRPLRLMFFNPVNFLQDSPYPSVGASRKTPGHCHLHESFCRAGRAGRQHQKQEYRNKTFDSFHSLPHPSIITLHHSLSLIHGPEKRNSNFELTGHDYSGIKNPDLEKKEMIMALSLLSPLILASASPRRKELLRAVGLTFKIRPADVDETGLPDESPRAHVRRLSGKKAAVIARQYPKALVLGADTIVVIDGQILGKPRDQKQARVMLRQLSNRRHNVFTGFTIACGQTGVVKTGVVQSAVHFKEICPEEMDWYVNSREPYDKAGGYAAQGMGASFIRSIRGSYTNVIGLPLCEVVEALKSVNALQFRKPV